MDDTQEFRVTLPLGLAEQVERKVESGAYASVDDVIQDGIQALLDRDGVLERWLKDEVVKSIEECKIDPSSMIPADQIMDRVRAMARDKKLADG